MFWLVPLTRKAKRGKCLQVSPPPPPPKRDSSALVSQLFHHSNFPTSARSSCLSGFPEYCSCHVSFKLLANLRVIFKIHFFRYQLFYLMMVQNNIEILIAWITVICCWGKERPSNLLGNVMLCYPRKKKHSLGANQC